MEGLTYTGFLPVPESLLLPQAASRMNKKAITK